MFLDLDGPQYGRMAVLTALDVNRMRVVEGAYKAKHPDTVFTGEPSGTFLHAEIMGLMRSGDWDKLCPAAKLKIHQAARDQHAADVIIPARQAGKNVITKRYDADSWAHQFWGEEWHNGVIKSIFLQQREVDLRHALPSGYVYLDEDPEEAYQLKLLEAETRPRRASEVRDLDYYKRVSAGYHDFSGHVTTPFTAVKVFDKEGEEKKTPRPMEKVVEEAVAALERALGA